MASLAGTTALVTGAGRGIGRSIARTLAGEGAHVVLAARSQDELDRCAAEIMERGGSALAVRTDMASAADVSALVAAAESRTGHVDILVNNAGIGVFRSVVDLEVEDFDRMWSVNVRGVFLATKAVLPGMIRAAGGTIVNIASLAGKNGFKGGAGYGATKWALRGFASSLMLEVREHNIRVVTIFPGSVDTAFTAGGKRGAAIPQADDVAAAVLFAVTAPGRAMFSEIDLRPTNPPK